MVVNKDSKTIYRLHRIAIISDAPTGQWISELFISVDRSFRLLSCLPTSQRRRQSHVGHRRWVTVPFGLHRIWFSMYISNNWLRVVCRTDDILL